MTHGQLSRRKFFQVSGIAAASLLTHTSLAKGFRSAKPAIQLSCCAANFHGFKAGADPLPAINLIGQLGFDGVELIALSPGDLSTIWNGEKLAIILKSLETNKLRVSRFGAFVPFFNNIFSDNQAELAVCFEQFDQACAAAKRIGASQIGYTGWSVPGTNPNVYALKKEAQPGEKITMPMPADLNWDVLWSKAVSATKKCLSIAKSHGLTICIEPHYHGIPQTAEQFLLLYREIDDPALGYLLDACWTTMQSAYPPLLAKMMGRHITNIQFRDTDAATRNAFVSFGQGAVDFPELVATLKSIDYKGFISLEEVFMKPNVATEDAKNFLSFMRQELAR
jgi:sugar phosphate isomerase/epimerase